MTRPLWSAIGACVGWGLFPVYWKQLTHIQGAELIAHRFVWSFVLLLGIVVLTGQWTALRRAIARCPRPSLFLLTGLLIGINWLTFLWSVEAGLIVEASLGYFITPLVSVALGVLLLRESLRPLQWLAIALALSGVLYLTFVYGTLPRIALILALSFGVYGLLKKTTSIGAIHGLVAETGALFLPAVAYLISVHALGTGTLARTGLATDGLLLASGLVTVGPLLLFSFAVRRLPLSLMGVLQYIAPSLQFTVGVAVYGEPFTNDQLVGFSLVWVALAVFTIEGALVRRGRPSPAVAAAE